MNASGIFQGGAVHLLESESKFDAIKELIDKATPLAKVRNRRGLEKAVIERERMQSTACGHGIAFAHGKTTDVRNVIAVLGVSRKGILFDSPDGRPVHLLFVIASSPECQLDYLMILSSLARVCYDEGLVREAAEFASVERLEGRISSRLREELSQTRIRMRR